MVAQKKDQPGAEAPSKDDPKKQFNVYLPASLIKEIKFAAIDDQNSLSSFVEKAMRDYLTRSRP
ncbi:MULTISPECIES: CopG family transcriptional regulator [Helcobacillus]|uniref:Putative HicB family RNase H-like nuclease n=1 Tax=Helcobacillus massiliensis TaxID=521392 RepID=A0A839QVP6_9MICO|nr:MULTISPECIES: CopG family transcriptional regulator [Helcobacillus]MBB3023708.1 putative HicB family RNase H-like nuclease [Helcobacillus massiliensis]MCG7427228.1 ribbon-helix-helix domain-containing protein [Helcobacillus sp. ACRRO]MDK7741291.1 CopG family transcriptional regulator [Helcobacillus massiliensis]WOO92858.1 CopG family transcriptional regulator [Helcobacillus massiliensis]